VSNLRLCSYFVVFRSSMENAHAASRTRARTPTASPGRAPHSEEARNLLSPTNAASTVLEAALTTLSYGYANATTMDGLNQEDSRPFFVEPVASNLAGLDNITHDLQGIGAQFSAFVNENPHLAEPEIASWLSHLAEPEADKQFALNRWLACTNQPFALLSPLEVSGPYQTPWYPEQQGPHGYAAADSEVAERNGSARGDVGLTNYGQSWQMH
jgi:hypothetical protein